MIKDLKLWRFVEETLAEGRPVALLVVTASWGSSPGRRGFKMAVSRDAFEGSIGGGVMEVSLAEEARLLVTDGAEFESVQKKQVHRKASEAASGMICSGEQTVFRKVLLPQDLPAVRECIVAERDGAHRVLELGPELFLLSNPDSSRSDSAIYRESIGVSDELTIVGGGHCSLALSKLMSDLGFRVKVFDDRPGLSTLEGNTYADRIEVIDEYSRIAEQIAGGPRSYVAVMTIGFVHDKVVIRELIDKEFAYFGVLGSKAKMAVLLKELEEEGVDKNKLRRIRTPIGLKINSRTPEEIAVSIAAEIISIKNKALI
ncbi:MAG: XdhC family protein [Pyrinomonadaceae bacterium]|nr:XdhC family protein [Pyrinomonadaceae bacterium]